MAARHIRFLRRFHAGAAVFWALMAVPTVVWFRDSILWVAFMSLYANFAAEMAAYQGARAEESNDQDRLQRSGEDR